MVRGKKRKVLAVVGAVGARKQRKQMRKVEQFGVVDLELEFFRWLAALRRVVQISKLRRENKMDEDLNLKKVVKDHVLKVLEMHHGSLQKAARSLGIGRTTIYRLMKKWGIR